VLKNLLKVMVCTVAQLPPSDPVARFEGSNVGENKSISFPSEM
jgi:hypothetical protein